MTSISARLAPLRGLTINAITPLVDNLKPMSRSSSDRPASAYPLICFSYNAEKILLPHTKDMEETVKLLRYYLEMPKDEDIELTTKWGGHSGVRLVAATWPYIAGAVEDIKVVTYAKGPLSP